MQGTGTGAVAAGPRWGASSGRVALAALAAYAVLLWISRPAAPFEWDEVLAQRAVLKYDVATHSPQPPGFPAYIAAAKAVNVITGDPLLALQVVGIVWALGGARGGLDARPPAGRAAGGGRGRGGGAGGASRVSLQGRGRDLRRHRDVRLRRRGARVVAAVERPALLPLAGAACGVVVGVRPQSGRSACPALIWAL